MESDAETEEWRRRFIDYRAEDEAPSDPISGGLGA